MKKHFTAFLIVIIALYSTSIIGQISKGDYMLGFSGSISHDNVEPDIPRTSLGLSYLKMVSKKWMLGGGIKYSNSITTDFDRTTGERSFYPYSRYQITPQVRYYFSNKKLAPFASLNSKFTTEKYKDTDFKKTIWGLWTTAGIGVDYFIAKNVAIESTLATNIIGLGINKVNTSILYWNTSLKLFLSPDFTEDVKALASKVLKQGNFTTSANFAFNRVYDDFKRNHIGINPNINYFITDRLKIYVGGNYYRDESIYSKEHRGGFGLGAEYYQRIIGDFFSSARIAMGTLLSSGNLNISEDQSSRNFSLASNFIFHYFKKQKRWYIGTHYNFFERSTSPISNGLVPHRRWNFFGGLDYYISDKFYLKAKLSLVRTKYENHPNWLNGSLSFGMGYFFNASDFSF